MKKTKIILLLICLLIGASIAMLVVTDLHGQAAAYREMQSLLGAFGLQDPATAADAFQIYLESSTEERNALLAAGGEVLASSGYSFSGKRYISEAIFGGSWYLYALAIGIYISLFVAALVLLRRLEKEHRNTKWSESRLQDRVSRLEKEQEQQLTEITHFEENLYHQLKTPLTSLQLCFEQIKKKYCAAAENAQLFLVTQVQLHKLSRLVTLFLRDRKLSSNTIKFQYQQEALDQIVEAAVQQHSELANYHNVTMKTDIAEGDYWIHCDNTWLTECLVTLIENAIEHSPAGQQVEVRLQREALNYRIQIISTGSILTEEELAAIFTRYYTGSSAHYGIGLHMAKSIAKNHHGSIQAYNRENSAAGVGFDVLLPIMDPN